MKYLAIPSQWIVRLGPQHGPTGNKADHASFENALVPLEEERCRIAVMHINPECAGMVLIYMDEHENPLRYSLHGRSEEDAMLQAQIEYGVGPDEWEVVTELSWKDTAPQKHGRWRR